RDGPERRGRGDEQGAAALADDERAGLLPELLALLAGAHLAAELDHHVRTSTRDDPLHASLCPFREPEALDGPAQICGRLHLAVAERAHGRGRLYGGTRHAHRMQRESVREVRRQCRRRGTPPATGTGL